MVANNTRQKAGNSDLNIHFGPKEKTKPYLDTEATPRTPFKGYWGEYTKATHQADSSYYNYSRIGMYTAEMKQDQLDKTASAMENYNGYCLASTWLQCGPEEGIGGPFCSPGGHSNLGSGENDNAEWNTNIDPIHEDAGILWWLEFVKENYGPWMTTAEIYFREYKQQSNAFFAEQDGELSIEAESFAEQSSSTYEQYEEAHAWVLKTDIKGYSGDGYLQVLPDEWPEGGKGPSSPRDASGARLIYPIHIKDPGLYKVYVRGMSMGSESNGLHVGIDGVLAGLKTGASNMSGFRPHNEWVWEYRRKHEFEQPGALYLSKGSHLLYVWSRDDGFCFDKIVLSKEPGIPVGKGPNNSQKI
jgi:hypothetical protein